MKLFVINNCYILRLLVTVATCSTASLAWSLLKEAHDCFDIILIDAQMPDLNPYGFVEYVKQQIKIPSISKNIRKCIESLWNFMLPRCGYSTCTGICTTFLEKLMDMYSYKLRYGYVPGTDTRTWYRYSPSNGVHVPHNGFDISRHMLNSYIFPSCVSLIFITYVQ
jgi:hypothetical protein